VASKEPSIPKLVAKLEDSQIAMCSSPNWAWHGLGVYKSTCKRRTPLYHTFACRVVENKLKMPPAPAYYGEQAVPGETTSCPTYQNLVGIISMDGCILYTGAYVVKEIHKKDRIYSCGLLDPDPAPQVFLLAYHFGW
jgi:hypothetical protein